MVQKLLHRFWKVDAILFPTCLLIQLMALSAAAPDTAVVAAIHPYDTLHYDKVVAYDYNGYGEKRIVKDGIMSRKEIVKEVILTNPQIRRLNKLLGTSATYGGGVAACFDPHLGVVYYRNERIVGYISICLDCNYLDPSADIPAMQSHKVLMDDGNYSYFTGFSKKGRKSLNDFCRELSFSHCKDTLDSMFD